MKKIGRQVCLLATGENNPRNGEGAFIRLTDGRILYGFTEYIGDSWNDHAHARLSGIISADDFQLEGANQTLCFPGLTTGQGHEVHIEFPETVPDIRRIGFMGFLVGPE